MSALTFSQALAKYRIAVAPTFRGRGSVTWFAGQRSLNGDGTNIILPGRRVDDKSDPEEALKELLALMGTEDTLVGDDDELLPQEKVSGPPPVYLTPAGAIVEEGGKFVLRTPDGKEYRASRKRDLVRRLARLTA